MCVRLNIKGDVIDNVGELRKVLPVVQSSLAGELLSDEFCLCNVDLKRTAELNGLNYKEATYAEDEDIGDVFYT